jgi:hypothetical protein
MGIPGEAVDVQAPDAQAAAAAPVAVPFTSITSLIPTGYLPSSRTFGGALSFVYTGSIIILIIFLILAFIHFTMFPIFAFSPDDTGIIPVPLPSDKQLVFTKGPAPFDLSANFINVPSCTYSLSMDVYLSGDFQAMTIPRVLFYRSTRKNGVSPPSNISSWSTGSSGSAGSTGSSGSAGSGSHGDMSRALLDTFPDTNFILWLDPVKNDLYASIMTSTDGTATNVRIETTKPIENIPIRKVFRLTVVFSQKFVELYINGNLEHSMALKNLPLTVAPTAYFFPVISTIGPNTRVANVAFWPRTLSVREVRTYGMPIAPETFFNPVRSSY